jgi:phosphoribosyl 1,2-cyclic phosphate phosphodiesterase
MIACECPVCTSSDPRDRRTRTSAVFSYNDRCILIDTAPELRLQCVARGIRRVDAIMLTHAHADHIVGLDDVRIFNQMQRRTLDLFADAATLDRVQKMFAYAFRENPDYPSAIPRLRPRELDGPLELFGREVIPVRYMHGQTPVLGFRVGGIAYCPDCNFIPDGSRDLLRDLDVLVLDGLRRRPHPTHFNITQAIEEARRVGARRTYFTHIAHELGHAETDAELPDGMALAYDGLVVESD